jgi:hypothetical protein
MVGVCVYSVFVLSCVQVAALRRADHSPREFCLKNYYRTEYETWALNRLEKPLKKKVSDFTAVKSNK